MPVKLMAPLSKEFILEETDKKFKNEGDPTTATFRQASQGEHDARSQLLDNFNREYTDSAIRVYQNVSMAVVSKKEVFLTLTACNLLDEKGEPLFKFHSGRPIDEKSFNDSWAKLPPAVADELHKFALEMNPLWAGGTVGEAG